MLLGISPLIMIYALNPNLRIYSFHGFMHSGVVYQLLNGNIPPFNPVLGEQVIRYPWGWHCVASLITKVLAITPFNAFALINIFSLCLAMVLVYKISQLVIEDEKANIFSIIISIFAISIMDLYLDFRLSRLLHISIPFEVRGVPIFDRFSNSNGIPIGLIFFLLSLFSVIKLFQNGKAGVNTLLYLISVLGCGFFYPAMLPGIAASTVLICLVNVILNKNGYFARDLKKVILLISALLLGILFLMPYFFSVTSGVKTQIQFFNLKTMHVKIVKYLMVTLPILVIIYINRAFFQHEVNKTAIIILFSVIVATLSCNIFISLPLETECKYFKLSTVTLGIVGGIAFYAMNQGYKKLVVFILLLLFLAPLYRHVQWKLRFQKKAPHVSHLYVEKGRCLYTKNSEENELYHWIRNHTDKNSIFIDSELTIPVLAQRQLFIGMDREAPFRPAPMGMKGIWGGQPGYGWTIDAFLRLMNGYDPDLIDRRQALVKGIYDINQKLTNKEMKAFFNTHKNMYVVVRTKELEDKFNQEKFDQIFRSSKGHFLVYQQGSL